MTSGRLALTLPLVLAIALAACSGDDGNPAASGLQIVDLEVGTGAAAEPGRTISVHYTGWLADGTQFDSSLDSGQPFSFPLGAGRVIQGWEEGLVGMKVGGKRRLIIPPELAYGELGFSNLIPPNAELTFEIELLDIQ